MNLPQCAHCNSTRIGVSEGVFTLSGVYYTVYCKRCGMNTGPQPTLEQAKEIWRKRHLKIPEERARTSHVFVDGPDGGNHHCLVCGISKTNDWVAHSCESFIIETFLRFLYDSGIYARRAKRWRDWRNER